MLWDVEETETQGPPPSKLTKPPPQGRPPADWRERFLDTLRLIGNVRAACEIAPVSRQSCYVERNRNPEFAAKWDEALEEAYDRLEQAAWERAVSGVTRTHYRKDGTVHSTEIVYSDRLLEILLRGNRPTKYRERIDVSHSTEVDRQIEELAGKLADKAGTDPVPVE